MATEPVSVCITVEFDGMALWTGTVGLSNLSDVSRGEYERLAVPRLLRVFEEYGVRCTWFVPGATALLFPHLVEAVVAGGHEIAHHGWAHEDSARPEEENRRNLDRGLEVLTSFTGSRPVGFREPGGHLETPMIELLEEYGFMWDSSLEATDFEPYYVRRDRVGGENGYEYGPVTDIVEMPSSWNLDDFPAFEFVWGFNAGLRTPSEVLEIWTEDFEFMRQHHPRGVFGPALHSQVIGRGHRIRMLERFLAHIAGTGAARFETVTDYMTRWKAEHPLGSSSDPSTGAAR